MAEAIAFAMVCAFTYALVSLLARCEKRPKHCYSEACKELVRYNCEEDMYNPVASLLLTTSEGAVKQLFSQRNSEYIHARNELLCFVAYTIINISLAGVPVPSGNFTGAMLIGGLLGRFWGATVREHLAWEEEDYALSGVYAMVGSAAMLSGFKQMAVAVIVFISGCANDPSLVPPLMVSVTVALLINQMINTKSFDEEQILSKGIPFLPAELPALLEDEDMHIQALDLCTHPLGFELPGPARLPPEASVRVVEEALACEVDDFPVIGPGDRCIGFATRARLEAAMASHLQDTQVTQSVRPQRFSAGHDGFGGERAWLSLGDARLDGPSAQA
ncbi:unnamed protein product [Prorocentrum cordatum]|uniref:Chloride channel protein n=1 Tax=Prorocentrum cordatum TaxID=2364126 RepID=A0ABN9Q0Y2_9DINO|nr:unnamed protein product [Polarella glacialis]